MKMYCTVNEEGVVTEKAIGFKECPFVNGFEINVDQEMFDNLHLYKYVNGTFIQASEDPAKTPEERIRELEQIVADLASLQLEVLMNGRENIEII